MKEKIGNCPLAPVAGHFSKGDRDGNIVEAIPIIPCEHWANGMCLWFESPKEVGEILPDRRL